MSAKMDFRALTEEEIKNFLPELVLKEKEEVTAFGTVTSDGKTVCSAVFLPSAFREDEAILCQISVQPETEEEIKDRFFQTCIKMLRKKKEYHSIYYRSTGTKEEMRNRYDLLISLGFRPTVFLGRRFAFTGSELFGSEFAKRIKPPEKEDPNLFCLAALSDPNAISYLRTRQKADQYLQNHNFSPEYSFLYLKNPENGGVLYANATEDLLTVTVVNLQYDSERNATEIFYKLMGSLIDAASKAFSPEGRIILSFDEPFCYKMLKQRLQEGEELFQEFLYTISV